MGYFISTLSCCYKNMRSHTSAQYNFEKYRKFHISPVLHNWIYLQTMYNGMFLGNILSNSQYTFSLLNQHPSIHGYPINSCSSVEFEALFLQLIHIIQDILQKYACGYQIASSLKITAVTQQQTIYLPNESTGSSLQADTKMITMVISENIMNK